MKLKHLLKKKSEIKSEIRVILVKAEKDGADISAEDQASIQSKKDELEKINSQLELIEGLDLEESEGEKTALSAATRIENSNGNRNAPAAEAKREFENIEQWLEACMTNPNDQRLEFKEYRSEQRMDTGATGGFAVPKQFLPLLKTVKPEEALVRPRANVIPAGDPPDAEISFPALDQEPTGAGANQVYAGVVIAKVAEGGVKPTTGFNLREITLRPHEIAAIIPFTDKLLRNWKAASAWASTLLRQASAAFEDHQFLTGNGVGGPKGIIDAASTYVVERAVSLQIALADIKAMYVRFKGNESKARWVVSPSAFAELLDMTGDGGGATNVIAVDRSTGTVSIYGIPVVRHERMRALGSKGDIGLFDFSEYVIKDGSGPILEVGYMTGQWEANKKSIKITSNFDGKSWLTKPYRGEDDYERSSAVVLGLPSGS